MKNIVHLCDCMEFMAGLPDKAYDLAIVDPPYGININHNMGRRKGDRKSEYAPAIWDSSIPDQLYFDELFRVSENQIIWGGNYFPLPPTACWILWDKKFSSELTFAQFEMGWTSFESSCKKYDQSSADPKNRIHPTQKPIALYKWLLSHYAKPGQTIFDSHVGSGSIRIACHDLGFDFEGCEIDADYWTAQEARFKEYLKQPKLFTEEIKKPVPQDLF